MKLTSLDYVCFTLQQCTSSGLTYVKAMYTITDEEGNLIHLIRLDSHDNMLQEV